MALDIRFPAGMTVPVHCVLRRAVQCGIEFFTTLVVRDAEPFWRHSHVERGDDEKTDFNAYPYAKPQPTTTPHPDS